MQDTLLNMISNLQIEIDNWYTTSQADLNSFQRTITDRIERAKRSSASPPPQATTAVHVGTIGSGPAMPSTPPPKSRRTAADDSYGSVDAGADWQFGTASGRNTPPMTSHRDAINMSTPNIMASPPQVSDRVPLEQLLARITASVNAPPLNFDTLYEQLAGGDSPPQNSSTLPAGNGSAGSAASSAKAIPMDSIMSMQGQAKTAAVRLHRTSDGGRPAVVAVEGSNPSDDDPTRFNIDPMAPCQVLVEFKRKRVLQYDSRHYVAPGEYVLVGGDRGEDLGLVIYTWCETQDGKVQGIGLTGSSLSRNIGVGTGKVLRVGTPFEVSQLHGIQTELERRAIDVCQQRVLDHALPMVIVDAEYQFDNKKLTFFYEAQQRLDFRELVRDLFKTFRARIWMELAVRD